MGHWNRRAVCWLVVGALVGLPGLGKAEGDPALSELRNQLEELKRDYEQRLRALEQRVEAAEQAARRAEPEGARGETAAAPGPARSSNTFNPAISLILQGRLARFAGADGQRDMPGFLLGEETGRGPEGFSLGESELVISANVDDKFYGFFNLAFNQEDGGSTLEIEEAYLQTLALPAGFTLKAGQFFSAIGYQNGRHSHTWDFVDQPLAYEAFLNTQLLDTGVQLSWVAPTDLYIELGAEGFRGDGFPAGGAARDGLGAASVFARLGGDVGDHSSWQAGLSFLMADPRGRASSAGGGKTLLFSGNSDLLVANFVYKWAPGGNFRERNFTFQTEVLHRHEKGSLLLLDPAGDVTGRYSGDQDGFNVQGVYQFAPRWRAGLRYDQIFSDNRVEGLPMTELARDGRSPRRVSAMLDFSNSEFSRLRLQYSREGGGLGNEDLFFLQYIMSIGSHGAHEF